MDKSKYFVKDDEVIELKTDDLVWKFKRVTSNDELDWIDDYSYIEEVDSKMYQKEDKKKLAMCKLRNIIEIPFTRDELKSITGNDKDFSDYTNEEKDTLFGKLDPNIMSELILQIDNSRQNKKKS